MSQVIVDTSRARFPSKETLQRRVDRGWVGSMLVLASLRRQSKFVALAVAVSVMLVFAGLRHSAHRIRDMVLEDGTVAVLYGRSSLVPNAHFLSTRSVHVAGDVVLTVVPSERPLIVTTRLLRLTAEGGSKFVLMAAAGDAGAQVLVLQGHVTVEKNYSSRHMEPDRLRAGDMSMVNISIDLMEKERFTADEIPTWAGQRPVR